MEYEAGITDFFCLMRYKLKDDFGSHHSCVLKHNCQVIVACSQLSSSICRKKHALVNKKDSVPFYRQSIDRMRRWKDMSGAGDMAQ